MTTEKNQTEALVKDIARLFVRYPIGAWTPLLRALSADGPEYRRLESTLRNFGASIDKRQARPTQRKTKPVGATKDERELGPGTLSAERNDTLQVLLPDLVNRKLLPRASDLREVFWATGGKGTLPKERRAASVALLKHLDLVPAADFPGAVDALRADRAKGNTKDEYVRWFNLIRSSAPPKK